MFTHIQTVNGISMICAVGCADLVHSADKIIIVQSIPGYKVVVILLMSFGKTYIPCHCLYKSRHCCNRPTAIGHK